MGKLAAVTDVPAFVFDGEPPTTAEVERVLAEAASVEIVEASPHDLNDADAARIVVLGDRIAELAGLLAVVDGGTGDACLCPGWPTILVRDAAGRVFAEWTLHHQEGIRGLGNCDAELLDGPALTDWLADHGLTGSRMAQEAKARRVAENEQRRVAWVNVAPPDLVELAEAASRREEGAEDRLAGLVSLRYSDPVERIRTLLTWAGFPPRWDGPLGQGTPWYEYAPQRMVLAESTDAIFEALTTAPLTSAQLDGAAELFTSMEWTRPLRAEVPQPLRTQLIAHVTTTGTDPMKFRMRHGYGRPADGGVDA